MSNLERKTAEPQQDTIDLLTIFQQFIQYKWLFLAVTSVFLLLGVLYATQLIPQYQSEVLLQIESKNNSVSHLGIVPQSLMGGSSGDMTATQIALIRSPFILQSVIKKLGLDISATPRRGFWSPWNRVSEDKKTVKISVFEVPRSLKNHAFDLVIDSKHSVSLFDHSGKLILHGAIGSLLTNANHTISLKISSVQAAIGTHFLLRKSSISAVIKSLLLHLNIHESSLGQRQNTGIIALSLIGSDPMQVIQTLNAIAEIARVKDGQKKSQEASQTLAFLYKQLIITKEMLEKAEMSLNHYRATSGKIDIKLQAKFLLDQLAELDKKITELRSIRITNLQNYTPEHPAILTIDAQTKSFSTERKLLEQQLKILPASDQIAVNLLRDVGVKKTLYLILLNKIQELKVIKAGTISNIRILVYAELPDSPLPKKQIIIYLSSILLGLFISAFIVFINKIMSRRVNDPHWSERRYNIANLAIIPFCKEQINFNNIKKKKLDTVPLLAHAKPQNLSIESLRSLRTSLQVSLGFATNNVISILGICPCIGKSFVSANLAYLLATAGKRVILVDGDLRRGTIHKYFNALPTPGIAEVLNQQIDLHDAMQTIMHENLTYLPRGAYPKDPSELLMNARFKTLLETLSKQFDVVLIDTPPALLVTDAVLIAAHSAINYLVLGAGSHREDEIEIVLKRFSTADVQINGTIFNFHRSAIAQSSYGKYSAYYYDDSTTI